ncbi:hypothetical protein K1719_006676 [Acacia pycnantha]|nr:hypothetical protein K1719_006676 [Acacia pycnantha]
MRDCRVDGYKGGVQASISFDAIRCVSPWPSRLLCGLKRWLSLLSCARTILIEDLGGESRGFRVARGTSVAEMWRTRHWSTKVTQVRAMESEGFSAGGISSEEMDATEVVDDGDQVSVGTERRMQMKVMVGIDNSEGSFYVLKWALDNLLIPMATPEVATVASWSTVFLVHVQPNLFDYEYPVEASGIGSYNSLTLPLMGQLLLING